MNSVLLASAILVLVLVALLAREMRLRRALQTLLAKFLSHWRRDNRNEQ